MHDFVCVYVALQVGGSCFRSLNGFPNIGPKGGYGYVDVMKGNKYWEVKPEGTRPDKQMERYDKTGLKRGGAIQEMYLPYGYGLLHVTNGPRGVVWYEYLSTPEKYPEAVRAYETSQERVNYARANVSSAFGKLTAGEAPQMTGAEWGWVIIGALLIGSFTLSTT